MIVFFVMYSGKARRRRMLFDREKENGRSPSSFGFATPLYSIGTFTCFYITVMIRFIQWIKAQASSK